MIETFTSLLHDRAHWEFELFVGFVEMLAFDVLLFGLLFPFLKKHWRHHLAHDERDLNELFGHGLPHYSPWIFYKGSLWNTITKERLTIDQFVNETVTRDSINFDGLFSELFDAFGIKPKS